MYTDLYEMKTSKNYRETITEEEKNSIIDKNRNDL